jgi:crossover junction endodeoxyribonuclease RuvC
VIIVGLDLSLTSTGVAICTSETEEVYTLKKSKHTGVKRLIELRETIREIVTDADMVVVENYAFGARNQAHQAGELGGVVKVMLHEMGKKWILVAPTQLKKFVAGGGRRTKELIIMQVYKRWGVECFTSDEADAFTLAKIGQALVGDIELTKFQKEVIEKLRGESQK